MFDVTFMTPKILGGSYPFFVGGDVCAPLYNEAS